MPTTIRRAPSGLPLEVLIPGDASLTLVNLWSRTTGDSAADGLFVPLPETNVCLVIATGPGGASGGANCNATSDRAAASAGAPGGGTAISRQLADDIRALVGGGAAWAIGDRGIGGAPGANATNNPGVSIHTDWAPGTPLALQGQAPALGIGIVATTANSTVGPRQQGGQGVGGIFNIQGGAGDAGHGFIYKDASNANAPYCRAGIGGASFWGGGGAIQPFNGVNIIAGQSGVAPGSGASGAVAVNTTVGASGARGARGIIMVLEFR